MRLSKLLFGTLLVAASASSLAQNVVLKVVGSIAPAACTPTFIGGATIDFGSISPGTLSRTNFTYIGTKASSLSIACDAPARVGIKVVDDRAHTAPVGTGAFLGAVEGAGGSTEASVLGLGAVGGKNIGAYAISVQSTAGQGDGSPLTFIVSKDKGITWEKSDNGILFPNDTSVIGSWSDNLASPMVPSAHTVFIQPFDVYLAVNKTDDMPPLSSEVLLDGQATFTLEYI